MRRWIGLGAWLAALSFAAWAGRAAFIRFDSAYYNREILPEVATDRIGASSVLEYEFTARYPTLAGLWVFFGTDSTSPPQARLVLSVRRVLEEKPFWSQGFSLNGPTGHYGPMLCSTEGLVFRPGERYVLSYGLPETPIADGLRIICNGDSGPTAVLRWSGRQSTPGEPAMLWLASRPNFPRWPLLAGLILLLIVSLSARSETSLAPAAWLVMAACCVLVGSYGMQFRLWEFWGSFWPDGYPDAGHRVATFFRGQTSFREIVAFLGPNRNGQAFLVPLLIGAFECLGITTRAAYVGTNAVFFAAAIGAVWGTMRSLGSVDDRAKIAGGLLFFGHVCVIRAAGSLQTDLAGLSLTALFAWTTILAFEGGATGVRLGRLAAVGVVGFLAAITRVALLPLLLVPIGLFLWSLGFERERAWRERAMGLVPTAVGGLLLMACWSGLGLWETLKMARAFAARPEFRTQFSWKGFLYSSGWGLQLGLPALMIGGRKLLRDRVFVALIGAVIGLEGLMAFGHIIPMLRYWAPVSVLGIVACIWTAQALQKYPRSILILGWASVAINAWLLWRRPGFAF